jgi:hypothetical protein
MSRILQTEILQTGEIAMTIRFVNTKVINISRKRTGKIDQLLKYHNNNDNNINNLPIHHCETIRGKRDRESN